MKKYFISMACMLTALVSCQKNDNVEQAPEANQPIKMTLTATIGNDDTKVSYQDVDNTLKTVWDLYDKVSVLSLDGGGNVLTNDVFTAVSAGKSADFEGTFSNDPATASVWVFYPALTEGYGTEEEPWQMPKANSYDKYGVLYNVKKGSSYLNFTADSQLQKELGSLSDLEQFMVMSGQADIQKLSEAKFDVKLLHRSYVLKVSLTLPKSGLTVRSLTISAKASDEINGVAVCGSGWTDVKNPESFPGGWNTSWTMNFGADMDAGKGTGLLVEDNTLTTYIVAHSGASWNYVVQDTRQYQLTEGDYLQITVDALDQGEIYKCALDRRDITKTTVLENGKMYRLSATLEN